MRLKQKKYTGLFLNIDKSIFPNKKSQVTIFIILGLIIVVIFLIIFLLMTAPPKVESYNEKNPQSYIEKITTEALEEAIETLSMQGGDMTPSGSVFYNGTEIVYICYSGEFYKKCISQRPLLVEHIEQEITNYITPKIQAGFDKLESDLTEDNRYVIESGEMKVITKLYPKLVIVEIDKKFKLQRGDLTREFDHFKINMINPIYDFAKITNIIANQEAQYCHFDNLGYMILYPDYDIKSTITGDSDTIYTITERSTGLSFSFATKSCLMPPGF
ncbi:MAG: hypothetical protein Q8N99_00420 [Nanoarchaeota archaeon]|nr:hypothetical protein [Nanoarchaeota archaeon]